MKVFGAPADYEPPVWDGKPDETDFGVLPENWDAVLVFMASSSQWQHNARGTPIALRYEGVDVVLRRMKVEDPDDAFVRLQLIETAAIRAFAANALRDTPKS